MIGNDGQHKGDNGRGMMHITEARVKGLCKDHKVKLEPVVYSGVMEISANKRTYTIQIGKWGALTKG